MSENKYKVFATTYDSGLLQRLSKGLLYLISGRGMDDVHIDYFLAQQLEDDEIRAFLIGRLEKMRDKLHGDSDQITVIAHGLYSILNSYFEDVLAQATNAAELKAELLEAKSGLIGDVIKTMLAISQGHQTVSAAPKEKKDGGGF